MDILEMKQKDFKDIPRLQDLKDAPELFDTVVIVPERYLHDSGWKCMSFVLCKGSEPIAKVGGGSDVLHIDGIGGYGDWRECEEIPETIKPKGWHIDCLPCGYLRLFPMGYKLKPSPIAYSDFEIFAVKGK